MSNSEESISKVELSVAIIGRENEDIIEGCLRSCYFADEICVIDGASDGGTAKIAGTVLEDMRDKEQIVRYDVQRFLWQDSFAQQRNNSFTLCTGAWIMRVDTDERPSMEIVYHIRDALRRCRKSAIRIRQTNLCPDTGHYAANLGGWETHPRIFRAIALPKNPWQGYIHEYVPAVEADAQNWNVAMVHFGWLDRKKYQAKENYYRTIPGSGFERKGSLVDRHYEVREIPPTLRWPYV